MGGSRTVNNTTTENQTREPPAWALPGMQELASRITSIIPTVPGPQYTGDFVAGPTAMQLGSLPLYQHASRAAGDSAGMMTLAARAMAGGGPQFGAELPEITRFNTDAAAQAATAPIMRQLFEHQLPQLRSSALASGAYGNSRMNTILPSLITRDAVRGAQEIGAGLAFQEHQNRMQNQLQAYGLDTQRGLGTEDLRQRGLMALPGMLDARMRFNTGAGDILAQAGGMQQGWNQAGINNELAKFDYNLRYPFQGLDQAAQLLAGLAHGYGSSVGTSTSSTVERSGGLAPILGGIMGLGGMIAGFPGIGSLFGGGGSQGQIVTTPRPFYGNPFGW